MSAGAILVIWRVASIWFERKRVVLFPLFWWTLLFVNMLIHASRCESGVATTDYNRLCKVTDVASPVLSIVTNISVMLLVAWRAWELRDTLLDVLHRRKAKRVFTVFVLMVESGALYVAMLITDLLVTSLVSGGNETVGRMVDCISGYSTVQLVGIYPTLLVVVLHESLWNSDEATTQGLAITTVHFSSGHTLSVPASPHSRASRQMLGVGDPESWIQGEQKVGIAV
ncbi:hypothetical protein PsYK624_139050 [Phanerochaete sordida]|uniref:Uncharacterized protein n=1 Tax=Phanerochaete sordida TaxID=48140 RepID=A0A9P3GQN3_9APHY|nr:hypothetical protein PsYK624_139050 [Phanerochaete sordida]